MRPTTAPAGARRGLALLSMLASVATVHAQQPPAGVPVEISPLDEILIRESVTSALAVPDGVEFDALRGATQVNGDIVVCGLVNARDLGGQYMGFTQFSGLLVATPADPTTPRFQRLRIGPDSCPLPAAPPTAAPAP